MHEPSSKSAPPQRDGNGHPPDPQRLWDKSEIAGERAIDTQQQMPSALVEAVKVGIRRALLDDKDLLPEAQQLVEFVRRELLEALPFRHDLWHADHD